MEFFLSAAIAPYSGILVVLGALLLLELVLVASVGAGISEASAHVLHLDSMPNSPLLDWLFIKETPFLMTLSAFLGGIAATGMAVQGVTLSFFGTALPTSIVTALGCMNGVIAVRGLGLALKKLNINHTTAISSEEFIGQTARLLSETACKGRPGEAMFTDRFGQKHFVMVEPMEQGVVFVKEQLVVLEDNKGSAFYPARPAQPRLD
jgi:hypothetical protein